MGQAGCIRMVLFSGQEQRSKTCLVQGGAGGGGEGGKMGAGDVIPHGQPMPRGRVWQEGWVGQASGTLQEAVGGFEKPSWMPRQALEVCSGVSCRQNMERWKGVRRGD